VRVGRRPGLSLISVLTPFGMVLRNQIHLAVGVQIRCHHVVHKLTERHRD